MVRILILSHNYIIPNGNITIYYPIIDEFKLIAEFYNSLLMMFELW